MEGLIGTPSEESFNQHTKLIEVLTHASQGNAKAIDKLIGDNKNELQIIKDHEDNLNALYRRMKTQSDLTMSIGSTLGEDMWLLSAGEEIDAALEAVQRVTSMLKRAIAAAKRSEISHDIFPVAKLERATAKAASKAKNMSAFWTPLFDANEIIHFHNELASTLTLHLNKIVQSVHIPIVDHREKFTVRRIKNMRADYAEFRDVKKNSTWRLTWAAMKQNCFDTKSLVICKVRETLVYPQNRTSVMLEGQSNLIVTTNNPLQCLITCSPAPPKHFELNGLSKIQLPGHCTLQSEDFMIREAPEMTETKTNMSISVDTNIMTLLTKDTNTSAHMPIAAFNKHETKINEINQTLSKIHEQNEKTINKLKHTDYHIYANHAMTSLAFIAIIITLTALLCCYCKH